MPAYPPPRPLSAILAELAAGTYIDPAQALVDLLVIQAATATGAGAADLALTPHVSLITTSTTVPSAEGCVQLSIQPRGTGSTLTSSGGSAVPLSGGAGEPVSHTFSAGGSALTANSLTLTPGADGIIVIEYRRPT